MAKADVLFIGFLGDHDTVPLDVAMARADYPPWFAALLRDTGVLEDVMTAGKPYSVLGLPSLLDRERAQAHFGRVVDFARATGALLVVWEYYAPSELFAPWRDEPDVVFLGCPDFQREAGASDWSSEDCVARWSKDDSFTYRGDGHPTARSNHIIARVLARVIETASSGRSGSSPEHSHPGWP